MLISFPPLSNMLKSSGSSYLISGANKSIFTLQLTYKCDCCREHLFHERISLTFLLFYLFAHTETSMLVLPAPVAFENPMIHGSAIHIAYRILAAFFIDMGAKTSIVENLIFINQILFYGII